MSTIIHAGSPYRLITEIEHGAIPLQSQYGTILYREWCARECERINSRNGTGAKAEVIERGVGMVAIARRLAL